MPFAGGTFSCSPSQYCPGFFGTRSIGTVSDGVVSVYFATPSSATFTFLTPITAFGVDMIGAGTVGATDVTISWGANSTQIYTALVGGTFDVNFVGIVDATPFTSVTFSATAPDDGIDFDRLQFNRSAGVPEPSSLLLAGAALLGLGYKLRKRS